MNASQGVSGVNVIVGVTVGGRDVCVGMIFVPAGMGLRGNDVLVARLLVRTTGDVSIACGFVQETRHINKRTLKIRFITCTLEQAP